MNGPAPTGLARYALFLASLPAQRCFGTMPRAESAGMNRTLGPLNLIVTLYFSGVSTALRFGMYEAKGEPTLESRIISYVNFTSSEVHSWPSWNFTPGASWKLKLSADSETSQLRAMPGTSSDVGP